MPGFPSQFSPELWQQARDLVAAGLTFSEVADKTGIGFENLRKKAQRDNWLVPSTVLAKSKTALSTHREQKQVSQSVSTDLVLAESVAETGQKGAKLVVEGLIEVIRRTFAPSSDLMKKEITSHKEAASMFGMFAKASGLDRPQSAVQVNLWGQGSGSQAGPDALDCTEIDVDAS